MILTLKGFSCSSFNVEAEKDDQNKIIHVLDLKNPPHSTSLTNAIDYSDNQETIMKSLNIYPLLIDSWTWFLYSPDDGIISEFSNGNFKNNINNHPHVHKEFMNKIKKAYYSSN